MVLGPCMDSVMSRQMARCCEPLITDLADIFPHCASGKIARLGIRGRGGVACIACTVGSVIIASNDVCRWGRSGFGSGAIQTWVVVISDDGDVRGTKRYRSGSGQFVWNCITIKYRNPT